MVQGDGQQVDLGLLAGYQTPDASLHVEGDSGSESLRSSDWLSAVQEDIQASEYHVTWQDQTYLADLSAAYQAPNRAHNLRTYLHQMAFASSRALGRVPPGSGA